MSVQTLKEYLSDNVDDIIKILEETDFHSISFSEYRNEIRCAYYPEGNPTSVLVNCDNLSCYVFSKDISTDLFGLISLHNSWTLPRTINVIANILNIENVENIKSPYIFSGFYKHNKGKNKFRDYPILPKETLDNYLDKPNIRFLKDNISLETQTKFNIRYDTETNRIAVPWFDRNGNLVGITGRYNFTDLKGNPKWKALKNFSKGQFLYGYYENLKDIEKERLGYSRRK